MAKRPRRRQDADRTELLGQSELFVLRGKGDRNNFFVWQYDYKEDKCPLCGGNVIKIHDHFTKTYMDYIVDDGYPRVVSLTYEFFKYRCLNEECRHVFAKKTRFASKYDNVTYRLEDAIAHRVIEGYSYSLICGLFQDSITRQAVGQIFHRWVGRRESLRTILKAPSSVAILKGRIGDGDYTLFISLDDGIRIVDILLGVNSSAIGATIREMGLGVETVLTDCDPTINDAVADYLPSALHIIPIELWLREATDDFKAFVEKEIRWCTVNKKVELITTPRSELLYRLTDVEKLLDARPNVRQPYDDFNRLRELIERRSERWVYEELQDWIESACPELKDRMDTSLYLLREYRDKIEAQTEHRDVVPELLADYTAQLEKILCHAKTFSEDVLKARVLYSVNEDLRDWRGIPIEKVVNQLEEMGIKTKRKSGESYEY